MLLRIKHILFSLLILILLLSSNSVVSQEFTRIRGKVIDAQTKEPIPFANVFFVGKNIGTITDFNGEYELETQWAIPELQASYLGYFEQEKIVVAGRTQTINFLLKPKNYDLKEIEITSKKKDTGIKTIQLSI